MQLYDCKVRLNGNMLSESVKKDVTAPEIIILRALHGHDEGVIDIRPTVMDKRPHADERERLEQVYGPKVVFETFGLPHLKLPIKLDDVAAYVSPASDGKVSDQTVPVSATG